MAAAVIILFKFHVSDPVTFYESFLIILRLLNEGRVCPLGSPPKPLN